MRTKEEIVAEMHRIGKRGLTTPELWNYFMALGWVLGEEGNDTVCELLDKYCEK